MLRRIQFDAFFEHLFSVSGIVQILINKNILKKKKHQEVYLIMMYETWKISQIFFCSLEMLGIE